MLSLFVSALALSLTPVLAWCGLFVGRRGLVGAAGGRRSFSIATGLGVLGAGAIAVVEQATNWISRELLALWVLPVAAACLVASLLWVWLPRAARRSWGAWTLAGVAAAICILDLPDVFVLLAAVVPYGASALTTDALANLAGFGLGVAVSVVTGWTLCRASTGAAAGIIQLSTSLVLILEALGQAMSLTRIVLVRGLAELPTWVFDAVVFGVNHQWVTTIGLGLASLLPVASALRRQHADASPAANPAEGRLRRAGVVSRRRFMAVAGAGFVTAALAMTVGRAAADTEVTLSPPEPLTTEPTRVWVAVSAIDDGHLHRFAYDAPNATQVRFIAIRKSTGAFVAALDACNICGPAGYYEKDGRVICAMCGVAMNIATIGFAGGCNPIPIDYTVADGRLSIARSVLGANAKVFE